MHGRAGSGKKEREGHFLFSFCLPTPSAAVHLAKREETGTAHSLGSNYAGRLEMLEGGNPPTLHGGSPGALVLYIDHEIG